MAVEYVRIFVVSDVAKTYRLLAEIELLAAQRGRSIRLTPQQRRGAQVTRSEVAAIRRQLEIELDELAAVTAKDASAKIKRALRLKRPATGNTRGLKQVVRSYPLPHIAGFATGSVGVASIAWLEKAVNPLDSKNRPYWEAIEYGSSQRQVKALTGWFFDGHASYNDAEKPRGVYRNIASPPGGVFVPGGKAKAMGLTGGKGGPWRAPVSPIRPKHFIRNGANDARADWLRGLAAIQTAAIAELRTIGF